MAERYVMVTVGTDEEPRIVPEHSVSQELWLQEQVRTHTELIPAQDFGLRTPLLVVGRETTLGEAGSADLIAVDMTGEVLVAELKRGPDNPDARRVIAQLLDYGAQLFGMTYEDFDRSIARRYFDSDRCHDSGLRGTALDEAAESLWGTTEAEGAGEAREFDKERFRERLAQCLKEGRLTYVVISTRISDRLRRVLEYLTTTASFRAFGVEVSHFSDGRLSVFVPRAIALGTSTTDRRQTGKREFLAQLTPHGREIFEALLERLDATGETIYWGTVGFSFRPDFGGRAASMVYGYPQPSQSRAAGRLPASEGDHDLLQVYFPQLESVFAHNPEVPRRYREATKKLPGYQETKSGKTGNISLTEEFRLEHVEELMAAVEAVLDARDEGEALAPDQ